MEPAKKIAVVGATGRLGRHAVDVLRERGHDVVPMSRGTGVDVATGAGLGPALAGVEVIIDAATSPTPDEREATEFFTKAARNLQQAGAENGVSRILTVSIIGIEHFRGGYNAAKLAHERATLDGPLPARILRAAQFHEFVEVLMQWGTQGDVAYMADMRTQLIAARSVAEGVADLVEGSDTAPLGNPVAAIAGPREESLAEAARRLVAKRGNNLRIETAPDPSLDPDGLYARGGVLPGPLTTLTGPTFDEWLQRNG
jgi:uncharacterized protein YbjT (DUF2867 family)